jgi:hypothetical protein
MGHLPFFIVAALHGQKDDFGGKAQASRVRRESPPFIQTMF